MVETPAAQESFQMAGTRAAVLDGPVAEVFKQHIYAVEDALANEPDFVFDLSKTLVESVCKTVLVDIGHPADGNWSLPRLLRETTDRLDLLPRNHPQPSKARDTLKRTVGGLQQTIHGLCELRNEYGMASHGRDVYSAKLDVRHAILAAQAADTIVSFLYRVHNDARRQTPRARVYYEDHAVFNDTFDRDNEPIQLGGVELLPSRVLFHGDREAYKSALIEYLAEQSGAGDGEANGLPSEPDSEAE